MLAARDGLDILAGLLKIKYFNIFRAAPPPRVIAYSVTWRCNASCDMCGIKNIGNNLKNAKNELTAGGINKIFKDPLLQRLDLMRFTGGEPFLKEDFADIVDEIIKNTKTKIYYITTNGFYTDKITGFVKRLAPKAKNLVIQVSLDASAEAHDKIRKIPGLYERVLCTLNELRKLRREYKFGFGINQTITPETISYLDEISEVAKKMGCDHKVYLAQEKHESDILDSDTKADPALMSDPGKDYIKNIYAKIEEYHDKKNKEKKSSSLAEEAWRIVAKYILLGSKNRIMNNYAFPNPGCLAMFFYLRLLPEGTVMPCTLKPEPMGNLKKNTFTDIWTSDKARYMREEVKKCKGCWVECDITPNIAYSFDVLKEALKSRLWNYR